MEAVCHQVIRSILTDKGKDWEVWEWQGTTLSACRDDLLRYAQNRFPACQELFKSSKDSDAGFLNICKLLRENFAHGETPWLLYIDDVQDFNGVLDLLQTLFHTDPAQAIVPRIIMSCPSVHSVIWDPKLLHDFAHKVSTCGTVIEVCPLNENRGLALLCEQAPEMKKMAVRFENLSFQRLKDTPKSTECTVAMATCEWSLKGLRRDFPLLKCCFDTFEDLMEAVKTLRNTKPFSASVTISGAGSVPPIDKLPGQLAALTSDGAILPWEADIDKYIASSGTLLENFVAMRLKLIKFITENLEGLPLTIMLAGRMLKDKLYNGGNVMNPAVVDTLMSEFIDETAMVLKSASKYPDRANLRVPLALVSLALRKIKEMLQVIRLLYYTNSIVPLVYIVSLLTLLTDILNPSQVPLTFLPTLI